MAVYKPNKHMQRKTRKVRVWFMKSVLLIIVVVATVFLMQNRATAPKTDSTQATRINVPQKNKSSSYKTFSGKQFEDLYNSFAYPNTQLISEDAPITGNTKADARIRQLALAKGYRLRSAPVTDTFIEVQKGLKLQQRAADGWKDLKTKAKKNGYDLELTAAYRSAEDEKAIFLSRLRPLSLLAIAEGKADTQVNEVLKHTAVPGYSRHHTGYTVDISCANDSGMKFEQSKCYKWLSKDNYLNTKKSGWIPSYPPGAGEQGPDPEPWEYVWVGTDALK